MVSKLPRKDKQIRDIKRLAKQYKIRVYWSYDPKYMMGSGFWRSQTDTIHILGTEKDLLSIFFHELGHSFAFRNYIWPGYHGHYFHSRGGTTVYTKKGLVAKIRTGYKAECWVDNWGETEMKKYYPNLKYEKGYHSDWSRRWLNENHLSRYKELLKKKG